MSTIASLLLARASDKRPGLVTDDQTWSWESVVAESAARAAVLPPHAGVLLDNVPEFVFLLFGAALAGTVVVGLNPTRRGAFLEQDIRHTDCDVLFTAGPSDVGPAIDIASFDPPPAPMPTSLPHEDDLYLLLFTSGSTGAPKAVRMTQGRAARTAATSAVAFTPDDVLYCAMPLFHGNALLTNLFPAMIAGASVVLRPKFSASQFLPDIRRHGCTFFNYVGRSLSYIVAQPPRDEERDTKLKWALGSEASARDVAEFTRRFGCPIYEGYGSSENAVIIQPGPRMPEGAMGKPKAGLDVAVLDPETGVECPPARLDQDGRLLNAEEAIGEIVGRNSGALFEGYYNNPEAEAERVRGNAYWTGDLGYRDEAGWFWFAGRAADWLRVDGENFAAAPVERVLARYCPGVAVYGVPDPVTGDQVMAAFAADTFDPDAFGSFLAAQPDLGTKWAPRYVRVVADLPLTATGKVNKQPLRRERWDTSDPVWVASAEGYRPFTDEDRTALQAQFAAHGRLDQIQSR